MSERSTPAKEVHMAAPSVTVVFQDEEGDEFPYTVHTAFETDETSISIAMRHIGADMDAGHVRPTGKISAARVVRS
jgi:hypothetical protein